MLAYISVARGSSGTRDSAGFAPRIAHIATRCCSYIAQRASERRDVRDGHVSVTHRPGKGLESLNLAIVLSESHAT